MTVPFEDRGLILAGDLYIGEVDHDAKLVGGFYGPINVPQLQITPPTVNKVVRISKQRSTYGQALDSLNIPGDPASILVSFDSLPAKTLAEALGGTVAETIIEEDDGADEITISVMNTWAALSEKRIIKGSVEVSISGGASLTENEHYTIDYEGGRIQAIDALAVDTLDVTYSYAGTIGSKTGDNPSLVLNAWVDLEHGNIKQDGFTVSDSLVLGVDLEVNYVAGMVRALTQSAVDARPTFNYEYEVKNQYVISGGTEINKPRALKLIGKNLVTGDDVVLNVPYINFNANQAIDLMGEDFINGQLEGDMITAQGKNEPYTVTISK